MMMTCGVMMMILKEIQTSKGTQNNLMQSQRRMDVLQELLQQTIAYLRPPATLVTTAGENKKRRILGNPRDVNLRKVEVKPARPLELPKEAQCPRAIPRNHGVT
jgi:hypothetical protein